jgi:hypothetical protein
MNTDSSQYPLLIPKTTMPAARRNSILSLTLKTHLHAIPVFCTSNSLCSDTPVFYSYHMDKPSKGSATKAVCIMTCSIKHTKQGREHMITAPGSTLHIKQQGEEERKW